jgi:ribosomal protein L16 Arg81 hydroxylase
MEREDHDCERMTDIVKRLTAKDNLTSVINTCTCKPGRHPGELADLMKEAADEITRRRADKENFWSQRNQYKREYEEAVSFAEKVRDDLTEEILRLRAENETLRRDVKTAVMGDSAELQDVKRENEKLRREAAIRESEDE